MSAHALNKRTWSPSGVFLVVGLMSREKVELGEHLLGFGIYRERSATFVGKANLC